MLLLDIDLAILDSMDALFDLNAPAAMWRGQTQPTEHGFPIDGRCFFGGHDANWGQTGGINAGVMLLAPDAVVYQRALQEVKAPSHPERIAGAGPEQDYLSRFFAAHWTHISVLYNFQLHQMFYALQAAVKNYTAGWNHETPNIEASSAVWVPSRLSIDPKKIRVVHFSGELKLWDRNFSARESLKDFVNRLLCTLTWDSQLWLNPSDDSIEYDTFDTL